jgi:cytochrome P450
MHVDFINHELPGGPSLSRAQQAFAWASRPLEFLAGCAATHGDCFTLHLPDIDPAVIFSHPAALRDIFSGDPMALYAGRGNGFLQPVFGSSSLPCADGQAHLRMRRLVAPAFASNRNERHGDAIRELTIQRAESWLDQPFISFQDEMSDLTLDVILRAILGASDTDEYQRIKKSSTAVIQLMNASAVFGQRSSGVAGAELQRRMDQCMSEYDRAVKEEIQKRRTQSPQPDILGLLIETRDPAGDRLTDSELRDQVLILAIAGHETTATTLAWCMQALLENEQPRLRLSAELDELCDKPLLASIEGRYLDAVVKETMRWMPVLPAASPRLVMKPVTVAGRTYREGVYLVPCPYLTHRREDLYPQANRFVPERFLSRDYSLHEFLPFGGGARRCIGMRFATFEMKIVLAVLLDQFQFTFARPVPSKAVRRRLAMAPLGGVRVSLQRRTNS